MPPSSKSMILITKFKVPSFSIEAWNSNEFEYIKEINNKN